MRSSTLLYDRVVNVTHVYLGPAADRFISRQVQSHLNKDPKDLTADDLLKLLDWISAAISVLTSNEEIVEEYVLKLKKLTTVSERKTT